MNEFQIINTFFKPLATSPESFGLMDDAAKISLKEDEELVISKDILSENTHFLKKDGGYKIAKKSLLSNLSDLACCGATPYAYMLGISKNDSITEDFFADFATGLQEIQQDYQLTLLGGDTIKSDSLIISVTIFGTIKKGQQLLRQNAKDGEEIYVSGFIGDSYLGLKNKDNHYLHDRHFFPTPRINLGQELIKNNISKCAADISDGLLADLSNICQSSNISADIFLDNIPFSKQALALLDENNTLSTLDLITGGEDFELIFSAPKNHRNLIQEIAKTLNINITKIGEFSTTHSPDNIVKLFDSNNQEVPIKKLGYEH